MTSADQSTVQLLEEKDTKTTEVVSGEWNVVEHRVGMGRGKRKSSPVSPMLEVVK